MRRPLLILFMSVIFFSMLILIGSQPAAMQGIEPTSLMPGSSNIIFPLTNTGMTASNQQFGQVSPSCSSESNCNNFLPLIITPAPLLAFPGAEGFGANAVGGRGGAVIEVTNLNDSGPGSLRAAIEAVGPRIVVFRVGGTIELQTSLVIENPYITIAGQTAPGDGITLKGTSIMSIKETHDVIIRHIRFRNTGTEANRDGFNIHKASHNIIIDHCSASWGTDEVLSASAEQTESYNITIQWCIIAEGIEGHSMGSLISAGTRDVSVHHNLYAHNDQRNPKMKGDKDTLGDIDIYFDFVNNVVYNWGSYATAVTGNGQANIINNYYKAGPNTTGYTSPREVLYWERRQTHLIYMDGNIGPNCPNGCDPDEDWNHMAGWWDGEHSCYESQGECLSSKSEVRINMPRITTTSAQAAYDQVLAEAGATVGLNGDGTYFWRRDPVDERIIADVINGTGSIISSPSEVGGFPFLDPGTPYEDTDKDGMANEWESLNGFNPDDPSDGPQDADGDGYTNIEEFLNGTNPRQIGGYLVQVIKGQ